MFLLSSRICLVIANFGDGFVLFVFLFPERLAFPVKPICFQSNNVPPHSVGDGSSGSAIITWALQWPAL